MIDFEGGKAILGIVTDITARKQQEKQSARQQERLERLALKAATAQEEERRRIAYGLHDDVAQIVAACRYKLTGIPDRDAPTTGEIDNLLAAAQERLRTLSFELASSTLYQLGLAPALEELCEIMSARYGVRFDCASRCDLPLKDQVLADILFQSARELLFNVVKHAGVSSANVVLACDDALARLSVEDRGRGFEGDPQNGDTGLGLFGIRQRLRPVDGRLDVRSKPGAFTRITIEIPLSGRAKPPRGIANAHGRRKKA